jgi:hypothetical protein
MKLARIFLTASVLMIAFLSSVSYAQNEKVLVVMDQSNGMNREVGSQKLIYSAQKELIKFIGSLDSDTDVGVMVFGHTASKCLDAELIIPFGKPDAEKVRTELVKINSIGNRGLVDAIEKGLKLLAENYAPSTLYIITSGTDECGSRLYNVEEAYQKYGKDIRVVVIGLDVDLRDSDRLKEMVASVNGTYKEAQTAVELSSLMKDIVDSGNGNLLVVIQGMDPDNPKAELKVFNDLSQLVGSSSIEGYYSMNVPTGVYDLEIIYKGRNYWNRQVFINEKSRKQVTFDLAQASGELRISIVDSHGERMKGNVKVFNDVNDVVYEEKGQSEYILSLPSGNYSAEVSAGSSTEYFDFIEVGEDSTDDLVATLQTIVGTAEIVVNNMDGIPINASILVEDMDGNTVGKVDFSSTYLVTLAPGEYTATVTSSTGQQEITTFLCPEGDNITVDINLESPIGSIVVYLTTIEGDEVFGRIKVFDEQGRVLPHFEYESIEDSMFTFDVPVGTYRIQANAEDMMRTVDGVSVSEGEETTVYIKFTESTE